MQEEVCRGVIHGVDDGATDAEIEHKLLEAEYEILGARRLGKSSSAVIVFSGKRVPYTVRYASLEKRCFISEDACRMFQLWRGGTQNGRMPETQGLAGEDCGQPNAMEDHSCTLTAWASFLPGNTQLQQQQHTKKKQTSSDNQQSLQAKDQAKAQNSQAREPSDHPSPPSLRTAYREILLEQRLGRRRFPAPHPSLARMEEVLLRQLHTNTLRFPQPYYKYYPDNLPNTTVPAQRPDGRFTPHDVELHQNPNIKNITPNNRSTTQWEATLLNLHPACQKWLPDRAERATRRPPAAPD
ncbi:hypothetical protein HPB48_005351 [Haemaphysalis longicornis]|uniref:Uncharacterized protein n=1 Tax=Haemaphysalis longicornis TaxID=44386 RepID=A0A9J6GF88_HAELO|nr:hypothetical protein HPB48_005351 [Haemaphysalis longicornis]